jgi:excisionase family DNA binding protein
VSNPSPAPESLADLLAKTISVEEAAAHSGFTTGWIRRLLIRGELVGVKIGRDWRLTPAALHAYLEKERRPGPKTN